MWRMDREMPAEELSLRVALEKWREEQMDNG